MRNSYYQPCWIPPSNELEHYGVKGMKWGKNKKRSVEELKGVPFGDVRVYETASWLKANKDKNNQSKSIVSKIKNAVSTVKNGLANIKKTLNNVGKKLSSSLNNKTVSTGLNALKKINK